MASEGRAGLLPIPCCARNTGSVARLQASHMPIVAERSSPSQSTREGGLGPSQPTAQPVDSAPSCPASLSGQALRRHSSSVRAVCVSAHVRICAGGDQQWSSLPRQLRICPVVTINPPITLIATTRPRMPFTVPASCCVVCSVGRKTSSSRVLNRQSRPFRSWDGEFQHPPHKGDTAYRGRPQERT